MPGRYHFEFMTWQETLESKHALETLRKEQVMIYQYEAKVEAAGYLGIEPWELFHLPYEKWARIDEALFHLKHNAVMFWQGSGKEKLGVIWDKFFKDNPSEIAHLKLVHNL
jgi:hypothetical protein